MLQVIEIVEMLERQIGSALPKGKNSRQGDVFLRPKT